MQLRRILTITTALPLSCYLTACSVVTGPEAIKSLNAALTERGAPVLEQQELTSSEQLELELKALSSKELDGDALVKILLLNNKHIQMLLEEVGIARAELAQAVLLPNPIFEVKPRIQSGTGSSNIEFTLGAPFLRALFIPRQRSISESHLEQVKAQVAAEVLQVVAQVKMALVEYAAAKKIAQAASLSDQAAQAAALGATKISQAGNMSDRALYEEQLASLHSELELIRANEELDAKKEALVRLLGGGFSRQVALTFSDEIKPAASINTDLICLQERAISDRLDVVAARGALTQAEKIAGISASSLLLSDAELSGNAEKDTDGSWLSGPVFSFPIPFFDFGQAQKDMHVSELRRASWRVQELEEVVRSEVAGAYTRLKSAEQRATLIKQKMLPLQKKVTTELETEYNAMLTDVFALLLNKRQEFEVEKQSVEALKDYWLARYDLERALGSTLPVEVKVNK